MATVGVVSAHAQSAGQGDEYPIKAAFLYRLLSYVEWPATAFARSDSPLVIGVFAADGLADALTAIVAERTAKAHPLKLRRLRAGESLDGVHVLFVGRSGGPELAAVMAAARTPGILLISESAWAFDHGSVIDFVVEDGKIRFDVSLKAAERAQLKISSRLLALARRVVPGGGS